MNFEPCWDDYTPKRNVDAMQSIYKYITDSNGHILSKEMKIGNATFQNPLNNLMGQTDQKKFFLFKNMTGKNGNLYDIYIMPINDDDVENLQELSETLEFEERPLDLEE